MKTAKQFEETLLRMGTNVVFHREDAGTACPCRTPEGFRDPAWHRDLTHLNSEINTLVDALLDDYSDASPAFAVILYVSATDEANAADLGKWVYAQGSNHVDDTYPGTNTPEAMQALITDGTTGLDVGDNIVFAKSVVGSADETIWVFVSKPGVGVLEDSTFTYPVDTLLASVSPYPPLCNEQGFLTDAIEFVVKAAIQPAKGGMRQMTSQRAEALLGDIQRDDQLGIFPVKWFGRDLDFRDWSEAGEDFIVFDGRRFIVIAADKLPDVDGDPDHHWEVGLRLVGSNRGL